MHALHPPTGPQLMSRRGFLAAVGATGAAFALAGCSGQAGSASGTARSATGITFYLSKPEVIPYMTKLVKTYNAQQDSVRVTLDTTSNIPADFTRNRPPDLGLLNYNMAMVEFITHGTLMDLSHTAAARAVEPSLWPMVKVVADYPGRTSVIPYSIITEAVIYNKDIFDKHRIAIPTTWSAMIEVCKQLKSAGVTPIYSTYADTWTVAQGLFDYTIGGLIDIPKFFTAIRKEGTKIGPEAAASFSKDFKPAMQKMVELGSYSNRDAASRHYGDGNTAFAKGQAAMYFQGPWAFSQIALTNPHMNLGTFPLPVTEDPKDLKVRLDLDLAMWIPEASTKKDAALNFLSWLSQPKVADAYNNINDGYSSRKGAPAPAAPALDGMKKYYESGQYYMGMSQLIPAEIPVANYAQAMMLGSSIDSQLRLLDQAWARYSYLPS